MLADGDLRHKLRFEDESHAAPGKGCECRVVVSAPAAQAHAFEVHGKRGNDQHLNLAWNDGLSVRLEHAERAASPRLSGPAEFELRSSRQNAGEAGAVTESAGEKLRS